MCFESGTFSERLQMLRFCKYCSKVFPRQQNSGVLDSNCKRILERKEEALTLPNCLSFGLSKSPVVPVKAPVVMYL